MRGRKKPKTLGRSTSVEVQSSAVRVTLPAMVLTCSKARSAPSVCTGIARFANPRKRTALTSNCAPLKSERIPQTPAMTRLHKGLN